MATLPSFHQCTVHKCKTGVEYALQNFTGLHVHLL